MDAALKALAEALADDPAVSDQTRAAATALIADINDRTNQILRTVGG